MDVTFYIELVAVIVSLQELRSAAAQGTHWRKSSNHERRNYLNLPVQQ
jgi:hypothetical protein